MVDVSLKAVGGQRVPCLVSVGGCGYGVGVPVDFGRLPTTSARSRSATTVRGNGEIP